jgi:hypothetical protein
VCGVICVKFYQLAPAKLAIFKRIKKKLAKTSIIPAVRAANICFLFICFKALVILKTRKKNLRKKCSAAESEKEKKTANP